MSINESDFGFKPDIKNNQILFGMKALNSVGAPIIEKIITGRPYTSFKDFLSRCKLNKTAMISLIKAGAFDKICQDWAKEFNIEPRLFAMIYYLTIACEPKSKLNLQNFNGLIQRDLIPKELGFQKQVFVLNKILKSKKKGMYYLFPQLVPQITDFYNQNFESDELEVIQGHICIKQKTWDKMYQTAMDAARDWLKINQQEVLSKFNQSLFHEAWTKYAKGTISSWEMEALCFYYHDHELIEVDEQRYGIVDFTTLPSEPLVDRTFKRNGKEIPLYKIFRIAGTVISKNDTRHSISLLTTHGVVNIKFSKEYFALYGRQISELQSDGTKKVKEKGWFTRGTKLLVQGFRRDDTFVAKTYKSTPGHQLYKITKIDGSQLEVTHERYKEQEV